MGSAMTQEYEQKWTYIRHIEDTRYKVVQWYFGIVGAVLAFTFTGLLGDSGLASQVAGAPAVDSVAVNLSLAVVSAIGAFLVAYSLCICWYIYRQKLAHVEYVKRVFAIDAWRGANTDGLEAQETPPDKADPAGPYLLGVAVTGASLTAGTWYSGSQLFSLSQGCTVGFGILLVVLFFFCAVGPYARERWCS